MLLNHSISKKDSPFHQRTPSGTRSTGCSCACDAGFDGPHCAVSTEVVTKVRYAEYTRDQRATLWNFAAAAQQPGGQVVSLDTLSNATVLTRGFQPKKQDMQTVTAQSDLSTRFDALGFKHTLQAGVDFAKEKKQVFGQITAAQGGIVPTRPNTTIGSPSDGASMFGLRVF